MNPQALRFATRPARLVLALALALPAVPAWSAAAADPALAGDVLLKLDRADALAPLLQRHPLTLMARLGARPIFRLRVVGSARTQDVLDALRRDPAVQLAEANAVHRAPEARKNAAWAIGSADDYAAPWAAAAIRLAPAQALSDGRGIRVAVLDTGIDGSHPALAGRLLPGVDLVAGDADPAEEGTAADPAYGHGTHVAALVARVAPQAAILPLRVLDAAGNGNAWVLAEALLHAVDPDRNPLTDDGAQVINFSLGSLDRTRLLGSVARLASCAPPDATEPVADFSDPGYADDHARCAVRRGAVVVAAAGNDASMRTRQYPAAEGVYGLLAVAASNAQSRLADFSNGGGWIDLAAPGERITSALPGGGWGSWSGTSMAAPLVAGGAALLMAAAPALTPVEVARRLVRSGSALCGTRLPQLDLHAALAGAPAPAPVCP